MMSECDAMAWGCCSSQSKREERSGAGNDELKIWLLPSSIGLTNARRVHVSDGGRCQRGDANIRTLSADDNAKRNAVTVCNDLLLPVGLEQKFSARLLLTNYR